MSEAEKKSVLQPELFEGAEPLPAAIVVGPFGLAEDWLARALRLSVEQLHAWHGAELGAPRDYHYNGRYFYTAAGVRRILQLAHIEGVDVAEGATVPLPARHEPIQP